MACVVQQDVARVGRISLLQSIENGIILHNKSIMVIDGRVLFKLHDSTVIAQEDMLEICNLQRRSPIQLHR